MSVEFHPEKNEDIRASILEKVRETSRGVVVSENNPEALKEQKKLFIDSVDRALESCSIEDVLEAATLGVGDAYQPPSVDELRKRMGESKGLLF